MQELYRFDISIKQGIVRYKVLVVGKNGKFLYHSTSLFLINVHTSCHLIISDWKNTIVLLDHNALTSIVSFNLPFCPTTRTLYQSVP